jgi:ribosomal protein S18 acetylase RimI-like enzyme
MPRRARIESSLAFGRVEIRPIAPHEFAAVGDLCVAAYARFVHADNHYYLAELRDVETRADAAEVLVAVDGDRLLGTVTFVPDGGPLGEIGGPDETEFRMLAVASEARGRGIGTALMRYVMAASDGRGVVCSSLPDMREAHRIYARLGFERVPERDWSPAPGVDLLVFRAAPAARADH